jgi:predicted HTH domain antitoxin
MLLLDDQFLKTVDMTENEIKLEFGIWLYEREKISLRKAARFAGLDWISFSKILCQRNIPTVRMTKEDFEKEISTVNSLL